jgi:hypothetical protein
MEKTYMISCETLVTNHIYNDVGAKAKTVNKVTKLVKF